MIMRVILIFCLFIIFLNLGGCSLKNMAMNSVADALSEGNGTAITGDNDPQFISEALPFSLKMMEIILESTPEHTGLLTATAAGFVQYGHGFVLYPAAGLEYSDYDHFLIERNRAKQFFLRARDYGLRALAINHFAIDLQLRENPQKALQETTVEDVPALYWTGAAWASALSTDKGDMSLIADLPIIEALMEKALELDESWDNGAIHEFFIVYDASRSEHAGGGYKSAEKHMNRAMELNGGSSISPLVSYAESACIQQQNLDHFRNVLSAVMAFDVDQYPQNRLANILAQSKAQYLLDNSDRYFITGD
jgi:hypothetical protein